MKKNIIFVVGCLISVGLIAYFTRMVDWGKFAQALGRFGWWWLVPGLATFYYSMYLRAVRWGLIFRPHHDIKGYQAWPPIMVGFAFNSILPGRVGEVVRCLHISKSQKTGIPAALASVVAERILDAVTLLGMLALSFAILPPIDPSIKVPVPGMKEPLTSAVLNHSINALIVFCAVLVVGVIVFMFPWVQMLIIRITRRMTFLPARVRRFIAKMIAQFARGFHALKQPGVMVRIVIYSVVIWVLCAVSNMAIARGFDIPLRLPQAMALITLIGIFILIPAAPGYWGLYEAGTIFSLTVMNVSKDLTVMFAYAVMIHLVQYIPIVVIGMYYARKAPVGKEEIKA
ncbi:MAG: lysylphosphatidylglycerol synthase transmembrane domain-containing protein [Candidatus Sumerlaeia bacterium]